MMKKLLNYSFALFGMFFCAAQVFGFSEFFGTRYAGYDLLIGIFILPPLSCITLFLALGAVAENLLASSNNEKAKRGE